MSEMHETTETVVSEATAADPTPAQGDGEGDPAGGDAGQGQGDEPQKTEAAKRREREKAVKERLRTEAEESRRIAEQAEARRQRVIHAGQSEAPPNRADFADPADYTAAKAVYEVTRRQSQMTAQQIADEAAQATQAATAREQQIAQINAKAWTEGVTEAKARYTDFETVAQDPNLPVTPDMARIITASDQGADILYHLGKNPVLAAQIASMPPMEAARAIGRIEATLDTPKPRNSSNAPPPITPVKGGASAKADPSKMTASEYRAWRDAGGTI